VCRRRATRPGRHAIPVAVDHVVDLIFGRWRSQILNAGAALDAFAHLKPDQDRAAAGVASKIGTDPAMLYRLFRALAAIGAACAENEARNFASPRRVHREFGVMAFDYAHTAGGAEAPFGSRLRFQWIAGSGLI
jgi:hypothetical protein